MANPAHCFYCFECLSASFESRDPPKLDKIEELWDQYERNQGLQPNESSRDHDHVENDDDGEDDDEMDDDELDSEDDEDEEEYELDVRGQTSPPNQSLRPQNPSISRLQISTPASASSSSTPSILSANSSNSALTNASSVSSIGAASRPTYASRLSTTESFPLFVTWNTISRSTGHKSLRGCIGTFDPLPLSTGLSTYALTSAFDDTRFSPIPSSLLPALSCSLTLLANFEPCRDAMDWTLGAHGLRISFTYRGRRHGATYLPDVAVEQGWSKEDTLESLMRKAGWDGGSGYGGIARRMLRTGPSKTEGEESGKPWEEVGDFRAVRYTGLKASASYGEWREWRKWIDERGLLK